RHQHAPQPHSDDITSDYSPAQITALVNSFPLALSFPLICFHRLLLEIPSGFSFAGHLASSLAVGSLSLLSNVELSHRRRWPRLRPMCITTQSLVSFPFLPSPLTPEPPSADGST
ncbi:hypothetical protein Goari_027080, partial [Gossypium aridum]|nr:hypothetical protein [Gossypium aridum]